MELLKGGGNRLLRRLPKEIDLNLNTESTMKYEVISTFNLIVEADNAEDAKNNMVTILGDMLTTVPRNKEPRDNTMHIRIESVKIKVDKPEKIDDRTYTRWTRVADYDPDTGEITLEPFKATK